MSVNPPYINDILAQPAALREALDHYPFEKIARIVHKLDMGEFQRIVMTGMGSSYNSAYPAWLKLIHLPTPGLLINTAELLHYGQAMITPDTLLWMNSQSGRSVEVVRLLEAIRGSQPGFLLSMTNDLDSPLGQQADLAVPIYAGAEATVSTKTYVNMLATLSLAAEQLCGGNWQEYHAAMHQAVGAMLDYLAVWQERVDELDRLLGKVDQLLILGRGPSLSAVWNGALIVKEAAKCTFEGLNVADFRHGPMELAAPKLTILVLEGAPQTRVQNRDLAREVMDHGGKAIWLGMEDDLVLPTLRLPVVHESARPLVEILPLQLLTIVMARRNGMEPGKFRHIGKVTMKE
jgi:glutamine---fructose-6-phosphate transaminase (isomerizing)